MNYKTHGEIPAPAVSDISDTKSWDDLLQKAIQKRDRHSNQYKDLQQNPYLITPPNPNDNQYRPRGNHPEAIRKAEIRYEEDLEKLQRQSDISAIQALYYFDDYNISLKQLRERAHLNFEVADTQIQTIVTLMYKDHQPEPTIPPPPFRFTPHCIYDLAYHHDRVREAEDNGWTTEEEPNTYRKPRPSRIRRDPQNQQHLHHPHPHHTNTMNLK